jgi:hypothetical protein
MSANTRSWISFIIIAIVSSTVIAQPRFSQSTVDFGFVSVNQSANKSLTIINDSEKESLNLKVFLSDTFFSLGTTSWMILPKDSIQLDLNFRPNQNITYRAILLFSGNRSPGQWLIPIVGKGKLSNAYYDGTFDLYDEALKSALKQITGQNYVSLGYNSARDQMYASLDNVGGFVTCAYTGRKAQFNTRTGATSNNFNCEHTWPQSMFGQNEPMRSDIHHLYSTDETANGKRDNDPFGWVASPTWSVGGSKWAGSVFEPRDEQKGNSARSMFYMAIRYQNYVGFLDGQENVLRDWNKTYAPDGAAVKRNNDIFGLQKNRNPFVDHPAFADRMVSISNTANRPATWKYFHTSILNPFQQRITFRRIIGDTVSVFVWNQGTSEIILDSVSAPRNGRWIGAASVLKPGESYRILLTETSGGSMDKPFSIHLKGKVILDTLQFELSPVGQNQSEVERVSIYPNPSSDGHFILNSFNVTERVQIYDSKGSAVFFTDISSGLNEIDLKHLDNGIYFVRILSGGRFRTMKVVIQK